jgi:TonB family protein
MTMVIEFIAKTSAVTAAVWIASLLLRRQSAALRHSLWMCALAAFLVIPALLPLARHTSLVHVPVSIQTSTVALAQAVTQPVRQEPRIAVRWNWKYTLPALWLAGSLIICLRRTRAAIRMKHIAARSVPRPSETGVHVSDEIRAPLTWGLIRPMILLPTSSVNWSPDCLQSVLTHEREHIRRRDSLSHWLAEFICAASWFHPFVWLARNRAAHERECACDDAVLRSGIRPSDYSTELLNLVSTLPAKGEPLMALSVLSNFEKRIRQILLTGIDRRPATSRARAAVALAAVAVIVPFAILRAQAPAGQGDLSGTVLDPSGARVPNAMVSASGSSGNREVTRADDSGAWTLSGIPAGDYTVEVRVSGFALGTYAIALAPGQHAETEEHLQLGKVQQTVTVKAPGQARHATAQATTTPQQIRVGGSVQATNLLRQVKPAYPQIARSQGIEGTVLMNAIIGKDGDLLSVTVVNKLADPDLAAAALNAVKQWHYRPTLLNGEPVEVITTITMNFELQQ